jgi:hypothetical protein
MNNTENEQQPEKQSFTGRDLLNSGLVGMFPDFELPDPEKKIAELTAHNDALRGALEEIRQKWGASRNQNCCQDYYGCGHNVDEDIIDKALSTPAASLQSLIEKIVDGCIKRITDTTLSDSIDYKKHRLERGNFLELANEIKILLESELQKYKEGA